MQYRTLGKFRISRLGLGTVQFGLDYGYTQRMTQSQVDEVLSACQKSGVNFLDTARDYGDSEAKIGSYLKQHPGGDWIVATKIKSIPKDICSNERALERHITASVRTSARLLGRPIQILQLHNAERQVVTNPHLWKVIAKLKDQGLFQEFGVSFYDPKLARPVIRAHPDLICFIQAPFNIFDQRFAGMFSKLSQKRVAFISRSTFLKGVLGVSENEIPSELKPLCRFRKKPQALAESAGLTLAESALLFVCHTEGIASSLIGVKSPRELEMNLKTLRRSTSFEKIRTKLTQMEQPASSLTDPRKWRQL